MMTAAEFKTIREGYGLTAQFCADEFGVSITRVYKYELPWRDTPLPEAHERVFKKILSKIDRAVENAVLRAKSTGSIVRVADEQAFWKAYPTLKGYPLTVQTYVLNEAIDHLDGTGVRVTFAS